MKNLIKFEEAAMFGICIFFLYSLNVPWWAYLLLVIGPDISMVGYSLGNRVGADCYNFFLRHISIIKTHLILYHKSCILEICKVKLSYFSE